MRTVIVSDLHLGNGQGYDICAGAEVSLVEWKSGAGMQVLGSARVAPTS